MNKIFILISIVILFGCNNNQKTNDSLINPKDSVLIVDSTPALFEIEKMKENIINMGDNYDFSVLYLYYDNRGDYTSILPYAVCMAHKFKNKEAYWVLYENYIKIVNNGKYKDEYFFDLDNETQEYLYYYLEKGASLNQPICKKKFEKINDLKRERSKHR